MNYWCFSCKYFYCNNEDEPCISCDFKKPSNYVDFDEEGNAKGQDWKVVGYTDLINMDNDEE